MNAQAAFTLQKEGHERAGYKKRANGGDGPQNVGTYRQKRNAAATRADT